jgi:hypothetical protein
MEMSNEKQMPVAHDAPLGAILNGRIYMDRLDGYPFECEAGPLHLCDDWVELRRCFEHLADWVMALPAAPAPVAQKITRDHVMSALALCPTDLSHPKRCEWIANTLNEATGQEGGAA